MKSYQVSTVAFLLFVTVGCAQPPGDYAGLKQKADQSYDTGRYEEAKKLYLRAKKLNQRDPDLYLRLGKIEFKRANFREAFPYLEQARKLDPANPESPFLLGAAHLTEGRHQQAIPPLEEALRLQPQHTWAMEYLGGAYYRTGRMEDAFRTYARLAEIDPENKYVHTYLGQMYLEEGNYAQAKSEFQRASEINPTYAENLFWLGWLELRLGSSEQGMKYMQQAIDRSPNDAVYHAYLGQIHFDQEQYQQALDEAAKAFKLNPEYRTAKLYKELAEQMLKRREASQESVDSAKSKYRQGNIKSAVRAFEALYTVDPEDHQVQRWLAYLYELSSDWEKARELYKQLMEADPKDAWAIEGLNQLNEKEEFFGQVQDVWEKAEGVQTEHFIIKTNLPTKLKQQVIEQADALFEQTNAILKHVLGVPYESPSRIKLYIIARPDEYFTYVSSVNAFPEFILGHRGYFSPDRNEIVFWFSPDDYVEELVHEFSHAHLWRSFGREVPGWLDEGMAEYALMKIEEDRYFGKHGNWWREMLETALEDNSLISLSELIALETREHPLFDPSAWSLVTFLASRTPEGQKGGLKGYCEVLRGRGYSNKTFWEVLGEPSMLEADWRKFIQEVIDDPALRWKITH